MQKWGYGAYSERVPAADIWPVRPPASVVGSATANEIGSDTIPGLAPAITMAAPATITLPALAPITLLAPSAIG